MGLDNGIDAKKINPADIPGFVTIGVPSYATEKDTMEVCYWRKCWGLRGMILEAIFAQNLPDEKYRYDLEWKEVENIAKGLIPFLEKEYFDTYAQSIWDYEEMQEQLVQDIINLKWLAWYMKKHPEVEVSFYDSY